MLLALIFAVMQPSVHLVWYDSYTLFPAPGLDSVRKEVETLFERNDISVRMHFARKGEAFTALPEPRVNVILSPAESRSWGLAENTMAAAVGERSSGYSIFVFHPSVRRALGHQTVGRSPRRLAELSRAVGRIVAHELVHVLVPERGHARSGLMSHRLTRKLLIGKTLRLDEASRRLAISRIGDLSVHGRKIAPVSPTPYLLR